MGEWLQSQLAGGFPALQGSVASGTLAVKQELVNELLASWLAANARTPDERAAPSAAGSLLPFLKRVSVRAVTGAVLVDFQISI